jgi:hypothetical protein
MFKHNQAEEKCKKKPVGTLYQNMKQEWGAELYTDR